jgi:hypothetical protein
MSVRHVDTLTHPIERVAKNLQGQGKRAGLGHLAEDKNAGEGPGPGGSRLSPYVCGRLRSGGSQIVSILGK